MKGWLVIPIWLGCFAGTTMFLMVTWLLNIVRRPKGEPYFKARSIFPHV